jgi:hypothetical protein
MKKYSLESRSRGVLYTVTEDMNILHRVKRRKANWMGHILQRNCSLKHVIEGKIEGKNISDGKTRKKT